MRLSRFFPRGYLVRSYLIVILPIGLLIAAMTTMFFASHVKEVNRRLALSISSEIDVLISAANSDRDLFQKISTQFDIADLMQTRITSTPPIMSVDSSCCGVLKDTLEDTLPNRFNIERLPDNGLIRIQYALDTPEDNIGEVLVIEFPRKRAVMITAHIFIFWTFILSGVLLLIAHGFLRNHVRSILNLADAADAFGRGEDAPHFKPSGAREVRKAARSVIRMRNRIHRYVDQRTQMLAAVSHDIRTPLTRLKLELALLKNIKGVDLTAAKADILEMEQMLDGYLAFARGEADEPTIEFDAVELVNQAFHAASNRARITLNAPEHLLMRGRPLALKRAIANLANNAADHADTVYIHITQAPGLVKICVEDNGPGIDSDNYNEALKPFGRLDAARNQNKSGVGLGLSIANDVAQAHGGFLKLERSELGGLSAAMNMPTSSRRL
ncbi:ATP-binding protein [Hirschia baltica]|uniref:histidine kinase n=1 Tax=Hirschia baltica (strain ATCC 49814 / DSM 5838 / IFAM 1418) TaxID=582402 RepID=C6XLV9_HIRBI|nr:ATP-binding protein [Hirschia baltica]ACT58015.1 histidine kinase [Hirschia baltica ATCC 49814]